VAGSAFSFSQATSWPHNGRDTLQHLPVDGLYPVSLSGFSTSCVAL